MKNESRKRWANPRLLPEIRHEYVAWAKEHAFYRWLDAVDRNTNFFIPAPVRVRAEQQMKKELRRYAQKRIHVSDSMLKGIKTQSEIYHLAQWEKERWEQAPVFSISKTMTARAARTGMTTFYLPSDFLPADDGVIFWQAPIGTAEYFNPEVRLEVDPKTGVLTPEYYASLYNFMYDDSNTPVVAAAWSRISSHEIYVAFYTDAEHHFYSMGLSPTKVAKALELMGPMILEREQILPLDQQTPWFTSESEDRLTPTARGRALSAKTMSLARDRREQGLPMIEQMCRTFAATLIYRKNTMDNREVVHASKSAVRRMLNSGASPTVAESAVSVIKIGQPLRYRAPKRGEASYTWTERRVVEPYFRYTQYVPATDEYRTGVFEVKGYIAGPPDAPIRNIDKVFLLDT